MSTIHARPDHRIVVALRIAATAAMAELLLIVGQTLRNAPAEAALYAGLIWVLVKCIPLLVVLPGLLRGSTRAATWLCFIFCFYFPFAIIAALPGQGANQVPGIDILGSHLPVLAVLEITVIVAGFTAGLLAVRWSRTALPQPAA